MKTPVRNDLAALIGKRITDIRRDAYGDFVFYGRTKTVRGKEHKLCTVPADGLFDQDGNRFNTDAIVDDEVRKD